MPRSAEVSEEDLLQFRTFLMDVQEWKALLLRGPASAAGVEFLTGRSSRHETRLALRRASCAYEFRHVPRATWLATVAYPPLPIERCLAARTNFSSPVHYQLLD